MYRRKNKTTKARWEKREEFVCAGWNNLELMDEEQEPNLLASLSTTANLHHSRIAWFSWSIESFLDNVSFPSCLLQLMFEWLFRCLLRWFRQV